MARKKLFRTANETVEMVVCDEQYFYCGNVGEQFLVVINKKQGYSFAQGFIVHKTTVTVRACVFL